MVRFLFVNTIDEGKTDERCRGGKLPLLFCVKSISQSPGTDSGTAVMAGGGEWGYRGEEMVLPYGTKVGRILTHGNVLS